MALRPWLSPGLPLSLVFYCELKLHGVTQASSGQVFVRVPRFSSARCRFNGGPGAGKRPSNMRLKLAGAHQ